MKLFVVATFLTLVAVSSSADQAVSEFIVNGDDASIRDHPYMAKVWHLNLPSCGGAILTSRSVLTVRIIEKQLQMKLTEFNFRPLTA